MTLKHLLPMGAAACALAFAAEAGAADLSTAGFKYGFGGEFPAVWSGYYLGGNIGYGLRDEDGLFAYPANGPREAFDGVGAEGGFGGVQIGINSQGMFGTPALVTGIEADIQGADISAKMASPEGGETYSAHLDWFGTVRGRAGYAIGDAMLYFTTGLAFGGLRHRGENSAYSAVYATDAAVIGYALGAGFEYKFSPCWSYKAEYLYLDLGRNDPTTSAAGAPANASSLYNVSRDSFHTVRTGFSFWINPPAEPLK